MPRLRASATSAKTAMPASSVDASKRARMAILPSSKAIRRSFRRAVTGAGSSAPVPSLPQFRRMLEQPRVLAERIAVGHAGDEIADPAQIARIVAGFSAVRPFRRQVAGMLGIAPEQVGQHRLRLAHDAHDAMVAI